MKNPFMLKDYPDAECMSAQVGIGMSGGIEALSFNLHLKVTVILMSIIVCCFSQHKLT